MLIIKQGDKLYNPKERDCFFSLNKQGFLIENIIISNILFKLLCHPFSNSSLIIIIFFFIFACSFLANVRVRGRLICMESLVLGDGVRL